MVTESKKVRCPDCGRSMQYLPEEPRATREYWCDICGGRNWRIFLDGQLRQVTAEPYVRRMQREWNEGVREAMEDIARNGLPF